MTALESKKICLSAALALLFGISAPYCVCGDEANFQLSNNSVVRKLEDETLARLKKCKLEDQSDALLHLGIFCYDNHDPGRAEHYLKQALALEENLARPLKHVDLLVHLAKIAAVQKDSQTSTANYKKALELAKSAKLKDYVTEITYSLGVLALTSKNLDEADAYFKSAYEMAKAANDVSGMMNALINQSTVLRNRNNTKQALELLNQAVLLAENDMDASAGQALLNIARTQHDLGNLKEAIPAYKKAIEVFKDDVDFVSQATACCKLADTYWDLRKIPEAGDYYQQALDVIKDEPNSSLKVDSLIGLGAVEADLGELEKAQKTHAKAYEMAKAIGTSADQIKSISQLSYDLLLTGYPEAALARLKDAEKLSRDNSVDAAQKGSFFMAIGRCYRTLGLIELAQQCYDQALKLFEDSGNSSSRALCLTSMTVLAADNQNKEDFEHYYSAAKKIYSDVADKRDLAILDYNNAQFMVIQNKVTEALALYEQALTEIQGEDDKVTESMILRGLGLAQFGSGHPEQAIPFYEKALSLADQSGSIEAQWDAHLGLGKCYKQLKQNEKAKTHLVKSVDLVEKERGLLSRDSFKTYNLDFRNDCFEQLVDLYVDMNSPYEALQIAERGRARAFLDLLSSRRSGRKVENFQAPISSNPLPETKKPLQMVAMNAAEPGTRSVGVIPRASQTDYSSAISNINASAPDIAEIKDLVTKSKSTVLEYYLLPNRIACWVLDPDSTIHMLPPIPLTKKQLAAKVALTLDSITHQPKTPEEVNELSKRRQGNLREMYDLLIKPVEAFLPKDEQAVVTIVPHGPMFMIPFAALISENKKFLVESHTLGYSPAIGVMRATQKLAQSVLSLPDKLLAFGNPITKQIAFLGALPYSEKEVHDIADIFGAANSVVKIGQDADKQTFEQLAPQFSEIHLATHGLVDEEQPMQSLLVLAPTKGDDGTLTVKDILAMNEIKAKLVVLSACQTGRGKITGDGVVGLSRAFIIAGTPSVLVSQWNVDDIITEFQMKSFYKSYLAHAGRSKALRQAQLDTIKFMEGKDLGKGINGIRANPRYWSAFQLIGDCS